MPHPHLFLASCEYDTAGGWTLTGLNSPGFVLVAKISPGVYRETYLIKATDLGQFKTGDQDMSFSGPNSLDPSAFLTSKGLNPTDYRQAVVTSQGKPIANMPNPQAGTSGRFEVRNNGAPVVGQLFRSDAAGSWQDTWALKTSFDWGNATTDVRIKAAPGLPSDPGVWATQAKLMAAGGQYIQYSWTFGPVT